MGRTADSSLMEAAEEYDALEEIEILRELTVESKKADISTPELLVAAPTVSSNEGARSKSR